MNESYLLVSLYVILDYKHTHASGAVKGWTQSVSGMLISGLKTSDNEHKVDILKVEEEIQNSNTEAKNILAPLCILQIPQELPPRQYPSIH